VAAGSALFALPGVGGSYWTTVLVAGASYMEAAWPLYPKFASTGAGPSPPAPRGDLTTKNNQSRYHENDY
jgi:hypothetical protein